MLTLINLLRLPQQRANDRYITSALLQKVYINPAPLKAHTLGANLQWNFTDFEELQELYPGLVFVKTRCFQSLEHTEPYPEHHFYVVAIKATSSILDSRDVANRLAGHRVLSAQHDYAWRLEQKKWKTLGVPQVDAVIRMPEHLSITIGEEHIKW